MATFIARALGTSSSSFTNNAKIITNTSSQRRRIMINRNKRGSNEEKKAKKISRTIEAQKGTRPYTLRSGDTLESIASKRKLTADTLKQMNRNLKDPKIGDTILIPSQALSARDMEIIKGITNVNTPRLYSPRKGETIEDVITKRKIDFADVQKLNPGVKLGTFNGKVQLKLPPGKYTVREREMLQGCGILPEGTQLGLSTPFAGQSRNILALTVFGGIYWFYFTACMRYQKFGTKLFGNDRPEMNQD
jgi:LysM repeat protein